MRKIYCDICGREMSTVVIIKDKYPKTEVFIEHEGRTLDICDECRNELLRYIFKDMRDMVKENLGIVDISGPSN